MYKISIIVLFIFIITKTYSQFPTSYPFETYLDQYKNLYVIGEEGGYTATFKYSEDGDQLLYQIYTNSGISKGIDIVANNNGTNIYTAGYYYNSTTGNYDIQILKYQDNGSGGALVWHREYVNSLGNDQSYGIAIDANENIYVCGYTTNFDMTTDYMVLKYNSAGTLLNSNRYPMTGNEVATDILTDNNFVYVMGYKDEPMSGFGTPAKDIMLLTYSIALANPVPTIVEIPGSDEIPTSFIISEYAYFSIPPVVSKVSMGGYQEKFTSMSPNTNYFIAYFDRNFTGDQNILSWSTDWGGTFDDYGTGITNDNSGNIVITGYKHNNNNNDDFATLKFNKQNGSTIWGPEMYNDQDGNDRASSISRNGNIYAISGYSQFSTTNSYITKHFTEGNNTYEDGWTSNFEPSFSLTNSPVYYTKFASDTHVLSDSSVITLMYGWNDIASAFAIVKYDAYGNEIYSVQPAFDRPGYNPGNSNNKLKNTDPELRQNYPNPFNPVTVISYSIPKQSYVTLKVYDLLGKEIAELVNGNMNAGTYSKKFDGSRFSSGVYIYKLTAVNGNTRYEKIEKMTLIK